MGIQIRKPPHGSAEWLLIRKQDDNGARRVSASNAAAVHGEHEYLSTADYATELLDERDPEPTVANAAMERGNALEPALIAWAAQQHGVYIQTPDSLHLFGRMIATLDGISAKGEVYECKTTRKRFEGTLPRQWYWQGVQQAVCAGVTGIWWVVLDGSLELHMHYQPVSPEEIDTHIERVNIFLAAIDMGMYPENVQPSYDNVATLNPEVLYEQVEIPVTASELFARYREAQQTVKDAQTAADLIKADIAALIGGAEEALINGEVVATWKQQTRDSFDQKLFAAEHPDLAARYKKSSNFRVLRIKGDKS
jgi:hypothetical protein